MDFGKVLRVISTFLQEGGHRHALIGGLAMAAYGYARTTLDLDIVVDAASQDEVIAFLTSRIDACESAGIEPARIIVDPGFGFGKSLQHNLDLIRQVPEQLKRFSGNPPPLP